MARKTTIEEVLSLSTSGYITDWNDHFWSDIEEAEEFMYHEDIDSIDIYPCSDVYLIAHVGRLSRLIEDAVSSGVDLTSDEVVEDWIEGELELYLYDYDDMYEQPNETEILPTFVLDKFKYHFNIYYSLNYWRFNLGLKPWFSGYLAKAVDTLNKDIAKYASFCLIQGIGTVYAELNLDVSKFE